MTWIRNLRRYPAELWSPAEFPVLPTYRRATSPARRTLKKQQEKRQENQQPTHQGASETNEIVPATTSTVAKVLHVPLLHSTQDDTQNISEDAWKQCPHHKFFSIEEKH